MKTLAEFKRWLGTPGATVTMVRHDWPPLHGGVNPLLNVTRRVQKLQTNGVYFDRPNGGVSWLMFASAKCYRFEKDSGTGAQRVIVDLQHSTRFEEVMIYELGISTDGSDTTNQSVPERGVRCIA